ncbi:ion transporter [Cochlodiniinecator piscidefendens]|uniref:ion transporter n=1 Tax=Cochlodiniinecator piscidefendens TaxID=2715756 RepID=UPI0014095658|nr:ion transporter [Cochlodiniinecator piscidefendens]
MNRQEIIDLLDGHHPKWGQAVALSLNALILLSAIAIAIETVQGIPLWLDKSLIAVEIFILAVFVIEYILRVTCNAHPVRYIFSFWGIVDLLSCLPAIALLQPKWQVVRTLRLIRLVRLLKLFRSSIALDRLSAALSLVKGELIIFGILSGLMLYVSAVGIYLFEHTAQPEAFSSIPESLWWAVASFTTVGYGDLYPITMGGRIFTSIVLFIGLGIVAVPSAIITAALLETQTTIRLPNKTKKPNTSSNKGE